jgi:hypothetical protein
MRPQLLHQWRREIAVVAAVLVYSQFPSLLTVKPACAWVVTRANAAMVSIALLVANFIWEDPFHLSQAVRAVTQKVWDN